MFPILLTVKFYGFTVRVHEIVECSIPPIISIYPGVVGSVVNLLYPILSVVTTRDFTPPYPHTCARPPLPR